MFNGYELLGNFLNFAGAVLVSTGAVLIALYIASALAQRRKKRNQPEHDFELDFTNMMILFQSMRDMLTQQKDLAREINTMVEKRVAFVRRSLDQALDEVASMRETQRSLTIQLEDARAELNALRKHLGESAPEPPRRVQLEGPVHETPKPPVVDDEPSPLRIVAEPAEEKKQYPSPDTWVGLDFGEDQPDPLQFDVPEHVPQEPEDPETARDAFRALLDLQHDQPVSPDDGHQSVQPSNGHAGQPVHARVYEYSDAGMTVPQISRELGIGKGEVRLILSLRKEKDA